MKIVLVSDTVFDENGVSRFIQDMASESKIKDKFFYVLTSSPKKSDNVEDNIINLKPFFYTKIPFYNELYFTFTKQSNFFKKIEELKPEILHISTPGPLGILALKASKKYAIPFVSTYHTDFPSYVNKNTHIGMFAWLMQSYMKYFYQKAEVVMTRSSAYIEILQNKIKIQKDRIFELKAGTNIKKFHPFFRDDNIWKNYDIPKDSIKILYVGRLSSEKNFSWLLSLYRKNLNYFKEKNVSFIVVGHGKILSKAQKLRAENIYMLGIKHVPELSSIYASCDMFITPSTTETLGQVVLEAMSSGLPCIVTDEGGPAKTLNEPEQKEYVLRAGDKNLWLEKIKNLVESKELREKLGKNNHEYMQDYSISQTFESFWNIHEQVFTRDK